jgi:hypothetical protein
MKIKKITLQNGYKRFKKTTINFGETPKKIVALVGPNGSGKSSVFDGMLYLQNRYAQIGQFGQKPWQYHSMNQDPGFESTWQRNVEIEFDSGNFETVHSQKNTTGNPKTIFAFRGPHRHYSNLNVTSLSKVPNVTENNVGASSTVDLDDKITQNYQRLYSLIDRKFKNDGKIGYDQVKQEVIGDLNTKLIDVLGLSIHDHGDIQDGKGTLLFKKSDQENPFEFNVLSSGEKEVVDLLLDIFLKKETFNDSVYIIDEPELHINTAIQRKLLKAVIQMIPNSCQLWIATHSIGFLNGIKQDYNNKSDVIWFEGNFGADEITLTPLKKNRENWKKIFQTALDDLTGLLSPERIVYCEGRKEPSDGGGEQGLDAEIYNTIFEEEYPDTLFVSSGGNTELDKYGEIAIAVLGKAFQDVELLLLKDMDINGDGSKTTDEQRTSWLSESKNRRMLKRKEIENYILDYEIVNKVYPDLTKENYKKVIPDITTLDVKEKVGDLMKACGVNTGMAKAEFLIDLSQKVMSNTAVYKELKEIIFN